MCRKQKARLLSIVDFKVKLATQDLNVGVAFYVVVDLPHGFAEGLKDWTFVFDYFALAVYVEAFKGDCSCFQRALAVVHAMIVCRHLHAHGERRPVDFDHVVVGVSGQHEVLKNVGVAGVGLGGLGTHFVYVCIELLQADQVKAQFQIMETATNVIFFEILRIIGTLNIWFIVVGNRAGLLGHLKAAFYKLAQNLGWLDVVLILPQ